MTEPTTLQPAELVYPVGARVKVTQGGRLRVGTVRGPERKFPSGVYHEILFPNGAITPCLKSELEPILPRPPTWQPGTHQFKVGDQAVVRTREGARHVPQRVQVIRAWIGEKSKDQLVEVLDQVTGKTYAIFSEVLAPVEPGPA